jgi:fructose-1,6-bisphosphatase I
MDHETLHAYLAREVGDPDLRDLLDQIVSACWSISSLVAGSAVRGHQGDAGSVNPQGEVQKPLDLLADDVFVRCCAAHPKVATLISEEVEEVVTLKDPQPGDFVVSYDPLDGSSNLDVDLSVGSIFAVSRVSDAGSLPTGRDLICAGYAIYGPSTMLVLTVGEGVNGFSLDPESDTFVLTHPAMMVPEDTAEFAINVSRQRYWDAAIQSYVADCIDGPIGPRGKAFNMRWTASMVAEVHRILVRGGVFLYPVDANNRAQGGKLRLLYEAYPMALIMEAAGAAATDGRAPLLDVQPVGPHQRTSVVLGSRAEVAQVAAAYD